MKKLFKIFLVVVLVLAMTIPANAAEAVGRVEDFDNIPGYGQYMKNKDHYQLDMVKPGILDSIRLVTNGAANLLFQLEVNLVNLTCTVLYYVSTIEIIKGLEIKIDGIQKNLYNGLFNNAFNLAFLFVGLFLAWLLLRNKYGEILNQLAKVFMVCFMAALLATNTSWLIKMDEEITASFSDYVAAAITGSSSGNGYAVDVAGQIWSTQVHQPWLTLEFGKYNYSNSDIEALLNNLDPDSEPREEFVQGLYESSGKVAFAESMRWERLVFSFLYLIPLIIKCLIVNAIVLLQLAFRVVKVFLYLLGIPVMILSLVPQLGGIKIIESWIKKIFEMSFMVVMLSFMLSVILWFDGILWGFAASMGWLTVIILQMGIAVVIFLFRDKILGIMETVQNVVRNPAIAERQIRRTMRDMGNVGEWAQGLDNRATQAIMSSGAYKQVASSANTIMQTWRDGLRDDIGSILPEGNVFQTPTAAETADSKPKYDSIEYGIKKFNERVDISKWDKATWDAQLKNASISDLAVLRGTLENKRSRPNLVPENAADALKHEGLASVPKENTGMTEDIQPLLSLYKNPEFARKDEPMAARYEKKAKPAAEPQKRSTRQASSETSNNTVNENKRQTGQSGQSAASDLGLSQQRMYREAERTQPTRKRPELEPTGTGGVIKQETAVRPVNSRDIAQDKPPAPRNDGLQTAAKPVISHDIAKDRRPTSMKKEVQPEARPVTSRNIVQDKKPMAETDKPVASKPRPVKLEKGA